MRKQCQREINWLAWDHTVNKWQKKWSQIVPAIFLTLLAFFIAFVYMNSKHALTFSFENIGIILTFKKKTSVNGSDALFCVMKCYCTPWRKYSAVLNKLHTKLLVIIWSQSKHWNGYKQDFIFRTTSALCFSANSV